MNVLLTCAGRRNYLVHYFRPVVQRTGGKVYAVDAAQDAPALQEADFASTMPRVDDEAYISTILEFIAKHRIGLVVSLNDLELPVLAKAKEPIRAAGAIPVVPTPWVVEVCQDKWRTV